MNSRLKNTRKSINPLEDPLEDSLELLESFLAMILRVGLPTIEERDQPLCRLETPLRQHLNFNSRGLILTSIHSLCSFLEICRLGVRDVFENLRVPIDQRKP